MSRSILRLILVAGLAACAAAPLAYGLTPSITSCDKNTIDKAIASKYAVFGVNCTLTLTQTINIPVAGTTGQSAGAIISANGFAVTLDGGHTIGVINVPSGASLEIEGVTIQNGRTSSSTGGGIANAGALTVKDCNFVGNTNAILNTGGYFTVTSSTFTGNVAPSGGAIMHTGQGKAYITNSSFGTTAPSSGNGGGETGGAISISGTSAEIDNSSFYGNIATQGGAIYAYLSTLTLTGDYFQGNTTNPGGSGGAIANLGSSITITNSSALSGGFQGNQAPNSSTTAGLGGAIYNAGVETFSCGVFCFPSFHAPSLTLDTVLFENNVAGEGAAIYSLGNSLLGSSGTTSLANSYVLYSPFFFYGFNGFCHSAIVNDGAAQLDVRGSTFSANLCGGIESVKQASVSVSNSTFVDFVGGGTINSQHPGSAAVVEYTTFLGGFGPLGNVTLKGSILAGSVCPFHITDGGYNLETANTCEFSAANNSLINTDPKIDFSSFGFNGGPVPTLTLPTGSPAIDQIPLGTLTCGSLGNAPNFSPGAFDQRGVSRPQGLKCDIGAIEHLFSNLPTSGTTCNGIYNKTFTGDITVFPGQSCVFLGGGISGNVEVKGGRFEVRYATVGGKVEIDHGSTFSIGPSATITGSLEIHNLEATNERDPDQATTSSPRNQVCGSNVNGTLDVHNNEAAVVIGAQDSSCAGNTIGGNVEVHNNSAATSIDGNRITGALEDHNNSGPTQIFKNLIQGGLACHGNSSITGGLDFAKQKQGQCSNF